VTTLATETRPFSTWQVEAWTGYERVGEVHFGFNLLANLLSRIRFFGAAIGEANEVPVDLALPTAAKRVTNPKLIEDARRLVAELQAYNFANVVRAYSLNMSIAGECYLVALPFRGGLQYSIRSTREVQRGAGSVQLVPTREATTQRITLAPNTYLARMWRPHPAYSKEPDSSMVGVADAVEELLMLQRLVRSATRSRLNAGMLFVPDGIVSAKGPKTAEVPIGEPVDPISALQAAATEDPSGAFLNDLMESMTTPIGDEGAASSVVPMLVMGPGEAGQQIQHITFERSSDGWLVERIERVLDRILQGLDLPKEVVTGMQQVKYSNAVVIDEGMYKANLEPLALTFSDGLSDVYLRPLLQALGYSAEEVAQVAIWYDPSEIVTRPNSSDEATQGLDRLVLSPTAWRREHGYAETDAPNEDDVAQVLLQKLTVLPESAALAILKKALPKIMQDVEATPPAAQPAPDGENVVHFPTGNGPAQPAADPQRTAVKQVGN
jgi:hypothetical protein